jgi:hypothetical protein
MTIALDQTVLTSTKDPMSTSWAVNTTATAAVGSKLFALINWWHDTSAVATITGGGLTWTKLKQTDNGFDRFAIWCADAPAGLASGTTLTVAESPAAGAMLINVVSFTGLALGTAADTTAQSTGTGASWSSGAATNLSADALFIGGSGNETATSTTSTPTAGTELADTWIASGAAQGFATGYIIAATIASRSLTGTWVGASSTASTGALVVFPAAGGGTFVPHRMPLGV